MLRSFLHRRIGRSTVSDILQVIGCILLFAVSLGMGVYGEWSGTESRRKELAAHRAEFQKYVKPILLRIRAASSVVKDDETAIDTSQKPSAPYIIINTSVMASDDMSKALDPDTGKADFTYRGTGEVRTVIFDKTSTIDSASYGGTQESPRRVLNKELHRIWAVDIDTHKVLAFTEMLDPPFPSYLGKYAYVDTEQTYKKVGDVDICEWMDQTIGKVREGN